MKVILGASILSLLLFTVWEHSKMVQMGYEIEQMKREKLHQHKRQQALLVEYYGGSTAPPWVRKGRAQAWSGLESPGALANGP